MTLDVACALQGKLDPVAIFHALQAVKDKGDPSTRKEKPLQIAHDNLSGQDRDGPSVQNVALGRHSISNKVGAGDFVVDELRNSPRSNATHKRQPTTKARNDSKTTWQIQLGFEKPPSNKNGM